MSVILELCKKEKCEGDGTRGNTCVSIDDNHRTLSPKRRLCEDFIQNVLKVLEKEVSVKPIFLCCNFKKCS